jgi:WD40 repeat protein
MSPISILKYLVAGYLRSQALRFVLLCLGASVASAMVLLDAPRRPLPSKKLTGSRHWIFAVAFSPDGKRLASAGGEHHAPGELKLWDRATCRLLWDAPEPVAPISTVAFQSNGELLVSASFPDREARLWDSRTGGERVKLAPLTETLSRITFSADGATAAISGRTRVEIRDLAARQARANVPVEYFDAHAMAFTADGRILATCGRSDHGVKLWDLATGVERATLYGKSYLAHALAFSRDGEKLAAGNHDGSIEVWDVATQRLLYAQRAHEDEINAVAFSPSGRVLATASLDRAVKLWDATTGREEATLAGHSKSVTCLAFSPDGKTLASGSYDKTVTLWSLTSIRR